MNEVAHTMCVKQRHDERDEDYWQRLGISFGLDGALMHEEYLGFCHLRYPRAQARDMVLVHYKLLPYETFLKAYVL